eukprot:Rmarinus@m.16068
MGTRCPASVYLGYHCYALQMRHYPRIRQKRIERLQPFDTWDPDEDHALIGRLQDLDFENEESIDWQLVASDTWPPDWCAVRFKILRKVVPTYGISLDEVLERIERIIRLREIQTGKKDRDPLADSDLPEMRVSNRAISLRKLSEAIDDMHHDRIPSLSSDNQLTYFHIKDFDRPDRFNPDCLGPSDEEEPEMPRKKKKKKDKKKKKEKEKGKKKKSKNGDSGHREKSDGSAGDGNHSDNDESLPFTRGDVESIYRAQGKENLSLKSLRRMVEERRGLEPGALDPHRKRIKQIVTVLLSSEEGAETPEAAVEDTAHHEEGGGRNCKDGAKKKKKRKGEKAVDKENRGGRKAREKGHASEKDAREGGEGEGGGNGVERTSRKRKRGGEGVRKDVREGVSGGESEAKGSSAAPGEVGDNASKGKKHKHKKHKKDKEKRRKGSQGADEVQASSHKRGRDERGSEGVDHNVAKKRKH